jgi:hypothetical protein
LNLTRALEGEDLYDSYKLLQVYTEIPNFLRPWVVSLLNLSGETRKGKLVEATASGLRHHASLPLFIYCQVGCQCASIGSGLLIEMKL